MSTITVTYTKCVYSPVSWLVRWALPRSRFAWALSSHCYIHDNENEGHYFEANPFKGVRRVDEEQMRRGVTVVKTITYNVSDAQAGMEWLKAQLGKGYDLKGAIGVSLTPDRNWMEDDIWYCFELAAGALRAAGRDVFENLSHVTEIALFSLKP
jgi:uncharacterized protein YycO